MRHQPVIPRRSADLYAIAHTGDHRAPEEARRHGDRAHARAPVRQRLRSFQDKGLSNYWGYNTIAFLAPQNTYSSTGQLGQQVQEFKGMVRALHQAGNEVILDVVYNHNGGGNHLGPTLSMRGNRQRGLLPPRAERQALYTDYTGTGTASMWATPTRCSSSWTRCALDPGEHCRRFRFDLAANPRARVLRLRPSRGLLRARAAGIRVSQVKLIAEPWDVGPGGYQVGNFPPQWTEWNGKYRDTVRDYCRGEPQPRRDSPRAHGVERPLRALRTPTRGIRQLRHGARRFHAPRPRLVRAEAQRGQRGGRRDGADDNRSRNYGVEDRRTTPRS